MERARWCMTGEKASSAHLALSVRGVRTSSPRLLPVAPCKGVGLVQCSMQDCEKKNKTCIVPLEGEVWQQAVVYMFSLKFTLFNLSFLAKVCSFTSVVTQNGKLFLIQLPLYSNGWSSSSQCNIQWKGQACDHPGSGFVSCDVRPLNCDILQWKWHYWRSGVVLQSFCVTLQWWRGGRRSGDPYGSTGRI